MQVISHGGEPPGEKNFLDDDDLVNWFGVSKRTIARWRADGLIDYLQPSGSKYIRYTRKQVEAFEKRVTRAAKNRRKD